ncbi:MAG TPA: hypothetical protein VK483_14315 [Chitinophagaceae bacterium]|nr:hypothetical protein [Chitinophagaceae bacterium]
MRKSVFFVAAILIVVLSAGNDAHAQQYKIRQQNSMMSMKTESTVYVKGMRKRTEPGSSAMGMPTQPTTIEQCDLQRTIKINDKKKLYFIEPFSKETEEVIDEDMKPVTPPKDKPVAAKSNPKTGGVINMWYNITDTGERKKMNGFTARHVWTSQKIKPSPDACSMKDSIIIKTDGWYIDLPQFNCPVNYRPARSPMAPAEKPDCQDKFVTHRSGKGKLGFPLTETRTIIMGNQGARTSEFSTSLETLEFSNAKLDSMLFEIPPGYKQTMNEADLQDKFDMNEMINQYSNQEATKSDVTKIPTTNADGKKQKSGIRIGVYEPKGDDQVQAADLQRHMVNSLKVGSIDAVAIASEEEARKYNCDYTLASDLIKIKSASKVGGLLKAIKNADPNVSSSFNIEVAQTLLKLSDASIRLQPRINGKYDGKIDTAVENALDEGCRQVLKELMN